jgi:hypothetical protein
MRNESKIKVSKKIYRSVMFLICIFVLFVSGCSAWEEKDEKDVKGITKIAFWDEQR